MTFISPDQLELEGKIVLRARGLYLLRFDDAVIETLKKGGVRPAGFRSQINSVDAMEEAAKDRSH